MWICLFTTLNKKILLEIKRKTNIRNKIDKVKKIEKDEEILIISILQNEELKKILKGI